MNPALPNFYYVYILRNSQRDWTYIGCTSDLPKRINEHISGKCFSTKKYLPLELVYYEAYLSKIDAFEREKKLKHSLEIQRISKGDFYGRIPRGRISLCLTSWDKTKSHGF